jgi:trans-aconitate methyltransferase
MQTKENLEGWYGKPDPWGYKKNPDDKKRRDKILAALGKKKFKKALDIGCGEGWLTQFLPAKTIHGFEISDTAATRFPENVKRIVNPRGEYDLIVATGVLYKEYDYEKLLAMIRKHAAGTVLLCNIKSEEVDVSMFGDPVFEEEFPYRQYIQKLRVYDFTPQRRKTRK